MRFRFSLGAAAGSLVFALTVAHWVNGSDDNNRIQAIPLGLSLGGQSGERCFGAYVPTRFGGVLTVTTTAGKVGRIVGPEGRQRANGEDVGKDQQGWYTFTVTGADKPLRGRDELRAGRAEPAASLGTSITGRRRPTRSTSRGPRATGGSTRCRPMVTTSWSPHLAGTSRRARTSSGPAPTACSRLPSPRATTRPGSPICMMT